MFSKSLCAVVVILVGLTSIAARAGAAEPVKFSGAVLKLSEVTDKPFTVNLGGLVVVIVRDSGSRPPQQIKVEAPRALERLGVVRGTQTDQGQALLGGGYTWHLFTPVAAGETTIKVRYVENGDDGKKVERAYKVTVGKQD
jgi:hypothetical protein